MLVFIFAVVAALAVSACGGEGMESRDSESGEHGDRTSERAESLREQDAEGESEGAEESDDESGEEEEEGSEDSSEHGGGEKSEGSDEPGSESESGESEGSESGSDDGEEDATQYALGDTFDQFRAGSRLIVSYNAADNAFTGTVENTTEAALNRVRVEIHLSNGVELGPTPLVDLAPGDVVGVRLDATTQPFETWSAHAEVGGGGEGGGEHGGKSESGESEGSESGSDDGEEDATQYALGDTFDQFRAGSRLIVSYNAADNAFTGTVENTTEAALNRVRVEIHLSNGVELGPTPLVDLAPGDVVGVRLDATTQPFKTWSAHAEVGGGGEGGGEHGGEGEGSEGSGEHGGKEGGEHSEKSREHGRGD